MRLPATGTRVVRRVGAGLFAQVLLAASALAGPAPAPPPSAAAADEPREGAPREAPLGFAGTRAPRPRAADTSEEFVPIEDRWRLGFPDWKRYERRVLDVPYVRGRWWDPYNQNVLKGDYPVLGRDIFINVAAVSDTLFEVRRIPLPSGVSAEDPGRAEFFGSGDQRFLNQNWILSLEIFKGDTAFKPRDWEFRVTPVFNLNYLNAEERGVVNIDVREGVSRLDGHVSLQELLVEYHLADLSPHYDFLSVRAGIQGFVSDFRGFVFADNNLGFRLFGNLGSNRYQWNAVYFRPLEKDTNSGLNRLFDTRGQHVAIVNGFFQDFVWLGYTLQLSAHYLHDAGGVHFDENGFLVRPAAVGIVKTHVLDVVYLGWTGDGHIGPVNLTHAFYQVLGRDSRNPIAARSQDISAQMAALELSMDFDWIRPRVAFFWASGDRKPRDTVARGFDAILDNPNFAGAGFSYWVRQGLPLTSTGLELVGRNSLLPALRSSKLEGQPNYVNPGLFLANAGADVELTPKVRLSLNLNFLRFHHTDSLELLLFQRRVRSDIGIDGSLGVRYRPFLNENVIITAGIAALAAGGGLRDVYTNETFRFTSRGLEVSRRDFPYDTLYSGFLALTFTF
jgi:hypothetical protein